MAAEASSPDHLFMPAAAADSYLRRNPRSPFWYYVHDVPDTRSKTVNVIADFFAVRPIFTLFGLRLVWIAFLVHQAVTVASVLSNPGYFDWGAWYALLTFLLHIGTNVVLVRLLIEVAAAILLKRQ